MNTNTHRAILVVSFGTTYPQVRKQCIHTLEDAFKDRYHDKFAVYTAFTSGIVRNRIFENEKISIPGVNEAMEKMIDDGINEVFIQPTHIIPGIEFEKITKACRLFQDRFDKIVVSDPLLSTDKDYEDTVNILVQHYNLGDTNDKHAVIFMGHGTEHAANDCYKHLQSAMAEHGLDHVYISTVEGIPEISDTMKKIEKHNYNKITLIPFMLVAGDHAHNDLLGDEESWKNLLLSRGYEVAGHCNGLGEIEKIRKIYLSHMDSILADAKYV